MKLEVEKAIKYTFSDPDWLKKVGIYAGFVIITSLLGSFVDVISQFSSVLVEFSSQYISDEIGSAIVELTPIFSAMLISLITFPVTIYFSGYMTEITKNVMSNEEMPLPDHTNIGYKLKLWLGTFVTGLVPGFVQLVLFGVILTPLILLLIYTISTEAQLVMVIITVVAWILGLLFLIALSVFITLLVVPAMQYLYLKNENFSEIFNISKIREIIKLAWKEILLVTGILYALNLVGSLLAAILCFISFIVKPILNILINLSGAHLSGQIYSMLKQEESVHMPTSNQIQQTAVNTTVQPV